MQTSRREGNYTDSCIERASSRGCSFFSHSLRTVNQIFVFVLALAIAACSGSKKYFKAAEKLEKQGLVNEAADEVAIWLRDRYQKKLV